MNYLDLIDLNGPLLRRILGAAKGLPEQYFDFNRNAYFAHATDPTNLQSILNNGLYTRSGSLETTTVPIYNYETADHLLDNAILGEGNHLNQQGLVFLEIPKPINRLDLRFRPDDLYDVLTDSELKHLLLNRYLPSRFNMMAFDASRLY